MKYVESSVGFEADELLGGHEAVELWNVKVGSNATITRGDLLSADSASGIFSIATASDAAKVLVIAAEDFVADSLNAVTSAYAAGKFNREKITFGGASVAIAPFEQALRTQGIWLTGIRGGDDV